MIVRWPRVGSRGEALGLIGSRREVVEKVGPDRGAHLGERGGCVCVCVCACVCVCVCVD